MFTMTGYIYALHLDGQPFRYVGMTSQQPEKRLAQHRRHSQRTAHLPVNVWIAEAGRTNIRMSILERVAEGTDVSERERHWIAEFQRQGVKLLNRTLGGQRGNTGYRHTDEERLARRLRTLGNKNSMGYVPTEEHRARLAEALRGKKCREGCTCGRHFPSPERGARISAAKRAKKA